MNKLALSILATIASGIRRHFKWWDDYRDKRLDGSPGRIEDLRQPHISAHLTTWSFSTEGQNE